MIGSLGSPRTEMWCKLLGSDTVDVPILIVSAADKLEFVGHYP